MIAAVETRCRRSRRTTSRRCCACRASSSSTETRAGRSRCFAILLEQHRRRPHRRRARRGALPARRERPPHGRSRHGARVARRGRGSRSFERAAAAVAGVGVRDAERLGARRSHQEEAHRSGHGGRALRSPPRDRRCRARQARGPDPRVEDVRRRARREARRPPAPDEADAALFGGEGLGAPRRRRRPPRRLRRRRQAARKVYAYCSDRVEPPARRGRPGARVLRARARVRSVARQGARRGDRAPATKGDHAGRREAPQRAARSGQGRQRPRQDRQSARQPRRALPEILERAGDGDRRLRGRAGLRSGGPRARRAARRPLCERREAVPRQSRQGADADPAA